MDIPDSHPCAFLRRLPWLRAAAAVVSGLLLATAFPPLGWWWMAFVAMAPLLALPAPRRLWERLLDGALFGYAFWACSLFWLNTVGFGAGWLLAIYCAVYFMLWHLFHCALLWSQKPLEVIDEGKSPASHFPGAGTAPLPSGRLFAVLLLDACAWCALEWTRAWLFTGFPWNQLGVAFAEQPILRQGADLAGLYGLSFLAFFTNAAFADALQSACCSHWRRPALPAALVLLACAAAYGHIRSRDARYCISLPSAHSPEPAVAEQSAEAPSVPRRAVRGRPQGKVNRNKRSQPGVREHPQSGTERTVPDVPMPGHARTAIFPAP